MQQKQGVCRKQVAEQDSSMENNPAAYAMFNILFYLITITFINPDLWSTIVVPFSLKLPHFSLSVSNNLQTMAAVTLTYGAENSQLTALDNKFSQLCATTTRCAMMCRVVHHWVLHNTVST